LKSDNESEKLSPKVGNFSIILSLIFFVFVVSCSKTSDTETFSKIRPDGSGRYKIKEIGISLAPPSGWSRVEQALIEKARTDVIGKEQIGCFDGTVMLSFYGPGMEQMVISRLKPNNKYDTQKNFSTQYESYIDEISAFFKLSGEIETRRQNLRNFEITSLKGQDTGSHFIKFVMNGLGAPKTRLFSIDISIPDDRYTKEIVDNIGLSVLSIK
jgi:hypothetical protein